VPCLAAACLTFEPPCLGEPPAEPTCLYTPPFSRAPVRPPRA
jgi:hypothetical protein